MGRHWGLIEELGGSGLVLTILLDKKTAKASNEDVEDMEALFNNDDDVENSGYVKDKEGNLDYGYGG
jgi:hypothetical protein